VAGEVEKDDDRALDQRKLELIVGLNLRKVNRCTSRRQRGIRTGVHEDLQVPGVDDFDHLNGIRAVGNACRIDRRAARDDRQNKGETEDDERAFTVHGRALQMEKCCIQKKELSGVLFLRSF
jgi:hypothetical protein